MWSVIIGNQNHPPPSKEHLMRPTLLMILCKNLKETPPNKYCNSSLYFGTWLSALHLSSDVAINKTPTSHNNDCNFSNYSTTLISTYKHKIRNFEIYLDSNFVQRFSLQKKNNTFTFHFCNGFSRVAYQGNGNWLLDTKVWTIPTFQ